MAVSAAEYFEVRWRTKGSDEAWAGPRQIAPTSEIVITELDRTKQYDYEVRSVSNCGAKSLWVPGDYTVPTVPQIPPVSIPTGIGKADGVQLEWGDGTAPRGDLQVEIQRAPAVPPYASSPPPEGDSSWARVATAGGTTWVDALLDTSAYWYRVRNVDFNGNVSAWTVIGTAASAVVATPELAELVHDTFIGVAETTDALRDDVDSTIAQVQVLQGQIGDILQADDWLVGSAYPVGDLVQHSGKLYRSLQAGNVGHEPAGVTDAWWEYIGNYASLGEAVSATAANVALNNNKITAAQEDIVAQSESIAINAAAIVNKADASALTTTNANVTLLDGRVTASAADITLLGAHNAGKTAFNLNSATVKIDGGATLAQTLTGLNAADGALGARVDGETSARVAGDNANAASILSVLAKTAAQQNLIPNSTFELGLDGWTHGAVAAVPKDSVNGAFAYIGATVTDSVYRVVPATAGLYVLSGEIKANSATGAKRLAVTALDASGGSLGGDTVVSGPPNGWRPLSVLISAPAGTAKIRVAYICEGTDTNNSVRKLKLEPGGVATTWNDGATAAQSASVTQSITAKVGPGGAYAQATTMLDVNGYVTGVSQTNEGTTGNFTIVADMFRVLNPGGTDALTWADGALKAQSGSYMTVMGAGFGVGNEFIRWFGPAMAVSSCSRAAAISYETKTGSAYFGGSIIAGTRVNAKQTTAKGAGAEITNGPFGSGGGQISVVMSLAYNEQQIANLTAATITAGAGTTQAVIELYRKLGSGTEALVASKTCTGTLGIVNDPGVQSTATFHIDGSVTYVDPDASALDRTYRAIVVSLSKQAFTVSSGGIGVINTNQNLSVVSQE